MDYFKVNLGLYSTEVIADAQNLAPESLPMGDNTGGPTMLDLPREPSPMFPISPTGPQWPGETDPIQDIDNAPDMDSTRSNLGWFDRSNYTRFVDDDTIRYIHNSAGGVLRKTTTRWDDLLASREKNHPNALWYPFPNEAQWKLGFWLSTCKSSQSKIDEFLDMGDVRAYQTCQLSCTDMFRIGVG